MNSTPLTCKRTQAPILSLHHLATHYVWMAVVLGVSAPFVGQFPSHSLFLYLLCQILCPALLILLFPLCTSGCSNKAHGGATKCVCVVVGSDDEGECGVVEGIDCALFFDSFSFGGGEGLRCLFVRFAAGS